MGRSQFGGISVFTQIARIQLVTIENNYLHESHKGSSLGIYGIDDLGSSVRELALSQREAAPSPWQLLSYS
jgi:hypothetical protein